MPHALAQAALPTEPEAGLVDTVTAAENLAPGLLLAAGVLVLTLTVLIRWRRKMSSRRSAAAARAEESPAERMERLAERRRAIGDAAAAGSDLAHGRGSRDHRSDAFRSADAVMVEMQELTRLCAAQVENRAARLEMLLREADDRIARLEEELDAERSRRPVRSHDPRSQPRHEPANAPATHHRAPRSGGRADADPFAADAAPTDEPPAVGEGDLARRVLTLADRGLEPVEIARELDEHPGKVELILALHSH